CSRMILSQSGWYRVTPWQPSAINSWISWVPEALLMLAPSGTDGSQTPRWRGQSRANPSRTSKFPASRENAGNFVDSGVKGASKAAKKAAKSVVYELIPDAPEQGIFGARAGNSIGRSGNFSPRSGTPTKVT